MATEDYLPDSEIDPITGKLRQVHLQAGSTVISPLNRNLLYTKPEVDAIFNRNTQITVSATAPSNPSVGALWVDIS